MRRLACIALLLPALAFAESQPTPGGFDNRVRIVDYNALDVVPITAYYGVSTDIQFGEGETILDKGVALGDPGAWDVVPAGNRNLLFIKPKAAHAETNLTVLTNKRVYRFALYVDPQPLKNPQAWKAASLTYALIFRYPQDDAAAKVAKAKADDARAIAAATQAQLAGAKQSTENTDYWVAGSAEVSPTAVRDDGRFIRLAFSHNRDMPAIYATDGQGNESLVNTNVEGNEIVVQRMVRKLTLRKGDSVACVVNKSFDLDGGRDNTSGTVSPDVQRVIKGARQ